MGNIWMPGQPEKVHRERINAVVIVHRETKRILGFLLNDPFAHSLRSPEVDVIELNNAHELDLWRKRHREQAKLENEEQEYIRLQKETPTRNALRKQLRERVQNAPNAASRQAAESALKCLEFMESRKKRYFDTFHVQEAYEDANKAVGETIVSKIMENK